ncbi:hypothetical protein ACR20V_004250 [Salmonella enterica]
MTNSKLTDKRTIGARIAALLVADSVPLSDAWGLLIDDAEKMESELQERRKADNQEPAGYHIIKECGKVGCSVATLEEAEKTRDFWNKKWTIRPYFYTAQPAPVVPDEWTIQDAVKFCRETGRQDAGSAMEAWNACRAAMPVVCFVSTPNGSEDTSRLDWLDAQNKRLNEYYGTSYGWKFDANFQRNAMMLNDINYPVMDVRQAIDEAITAAQRQEQRTADREISKDE